MGYSNTALHRTGQLQKLKKMKPTAGKKNILIVSRSFYPINSARSLRTTALVEEFARQGHNVTLLTVRKSEVHDQYEKEHNITIKDFGPLRFKPIQLNNTKGPHSLVKKILKRGTALFLEYPDIELTGRVKQALKDESGYDLMISIAMPHTIHWGVAWARSKEHPIAETWVADCGDPYVGREGDTFRVPRYFSIPEKWFCRKADYISVPFEGSVDGYFPEFHQKIKIIPQGLTFPEKPASSIKTGENIVPTFAYFGNMVSYPHYAIPFLKHLNSTEKDFRFIVYTRNRSFLKNHLSEKTLKKCDLRDYVPRERLFKELSEVDFLVYFPYIITTQRSLKLVDYAYSEKPVLSFDDSDEARITFKQFLQGNNENKAVLQDIEPYRIENVCAQFLDLCREKEAATLPVF